ncbi:MAG TPA: class I SAM-dependent methyltransferase [Phycisphaerae bacterium]|nr:class I SAM-dependent methyltransferase [Phycisphaerae bacterium]HNU45910.1 class I SAM-dependent methyltransferase [Phycisphaerae bacterium]
MIGLVDKHFVRRGGGLEFEMEAAWVRRHLPHSITRVLDIGCGRGDLFHLVEHARVVGVDHLLEGLTLTQQRFADVGLVCADACRLPFADGSFDVVTAQHVIEHLPEPDVAARECCRVLRPGGILLLLTPNRHFIDPRVFDDPTHVHVFDHRECAGLLVRSGFRIVDLRTLGLPWFRDYAHAGPAQRLLSTGRLLPAWRLRRWTVRRAKQLSSLPGLRWRGQTLCCAAVA